MEKQSRETPSSKNKICLKTFAFFLSLFLMFVGSTILLLNQTLSMLKPIGLNGSNAWIYSDNPRLHRMLHAEEKHSDSAVGTSITKVAYSGTIEPTAREPYGGGRRTPSGLPYYYPETGYVTPYNSGFYDEQTQTHIDPYELTYDDYYQTEGPQQHIYGDWGAFAGATYTNPAYSTYQPPGFFSGSTYSQPQPQDPQWSLIRSFQQLSPNEIDYGISQLFPEQLPPVSFGEGNYWFSNGEDYGFQYQGQRFTVVTGYDETVYYEDVQGNRYIEDNTQSTGMRLIPVSGGQPLEYPNLYDEQVPYRHYTHSGYQTTDPFGNMRFYDNQGYSYPITYDQNGQAFYQSEEGHIQYLYPQQDYKRVMITGNGQAENVLTIGGHEYVEERNAMGELFYRDLDTGQTFRQESAGIDPYSFYSANGDYLYIDPMMVEERYFVDENSYISTAPNGQPIVIDSRTGIGIPFAVGPDGLPSPCLDGQCSVFEFPPIEVDPMQSVDPITGRLIDPITGLILPPDVSYIPSEGRYVRHLPYLPGGGGGGVIGFFPGENVPEIDNIAPIINPDGSAPPNQQLANNQGLPDNTAPSGNGNPNNPGVNPGAIPQVNSLSGNPGNFSPIPFAGGAGKCAYVYVNNQVADRLLSSSSLSGYSGSIHAIIYDSATGRIVTYHDG